MYSFSDQMNVRVDYLKFLIALDWDRAQEVLQPMVDFVASEKTRLVTNRDFKVTVLNPTPTSNGKSRYIVEIWGEHTMEILPVIPDFLWGSLSRIDHRTPLLHVTDEALAAFATKWAMADRKSRNIATLNTRPRRKNNKRDVGGKGVIFGSRKSASHTVVYKRGAELPAIESRIEKNKAEDVGIRILNELSEDGHAPIERIVIAAAESAAEQERYRCIGETKIQGWENAMLVALGESKTMQASLEWKEREDEREWWESLSPEEQSAWQGDTFVPIKGKKLNIEE